MKYHLFWPSSSESKILFRDQYLYHTWHVFHKDVKKEM